MKKLDKLILSSFVGPFTLTFIVVVFILLNQHMLKYFDDIIGKNLGFEVLGTLFFYFSIFMIPMALPLAILLSSLITFSNFGEYSELTAMKSLGVSMMRSLSPLFIFIALITLLAFYVNNYFVPKAALEAYSLLYDIKQKKPALDLREGIFYNAIPGISIKADEKLPDGQTLKGIIIYDHREEGGGKNVIIAKSGKIHTMMNGRYLKLEIFDGYSYGEDIINKKIDRRHKKVHVLNKTKFFRTEIIFDLSSFGLTRTSKNWFRGHRIMRNLVELEQDIDSLKYNILDKRLRAFDNMQLQVVSHLPIGGSVVMTPDLTLHKKRKDSLSMLKHKTIKGDIVTPSAKGVSSSTTSDADPPEKRTLSPSYLNVYTPLLSSKASKETITNALHQARKVKEKLFGYAELIERDERELKIFQVQWHKILASSFACLSMFLIGAPLGAIIRKGGLGVPVIISIFFFVAFYIFTIMGEKWGKQGFLPVPIGTWTANGILLIVGVFFLSRAKADTRLLDTDFYNVIWDKIKRRFSR